METAYEVYGLGLDFDEEVLAGIHKRKVKEHHPDAGGDRAQFDRYQQAFETLMDPTKRFDERKREEERLQRKFSGSTSQGSFEDGFAAGERQGRADTYAAYSRTYAEPAPAQTSTTYTAPTRPLLKKPLEFSERMVRGLRIVHATALGVLASLVFLAASMDGLTSGFTRFFATACVVATFTLTYRFSFKVLMHVLTQPVAVRYKILTLSMGYGLFLLVAFVTNILGTMVSLIAFLVDRVVRKFKRS